MQLWAETRMAIKKYRQQIQTHFQDFPDLALVFYLERHTRVVKIHLYDHKQTSLSSPTQHKFFDALLNFPPLSLIAEKLRDSIKYISI